MTELYKKDTYFTTKDQFAFNQYCIEYDIKSAGLSICKEFKLLPDDVIEDLKTNYSKTDRVKKLGKMQINDNVLKKGLKDGFIEARRRFIEANDIEDEDIVSIKKDAIFVSKVCNQLNFGHIKFANKNQYTSFIRLPNRIELFYFCGKIDVKGIGENVDKHKDFILKLLSTFFKKMEMGDEDNVGKFMRKTIDAYKFRNLDLGYYREFNSQSTYTVIDEDNEITQYDEYWADGIDDVLITYNWENVILPLLKIIY